MKADTTQTRSSQTGRAPTSVVVLATFSAQFACTVVTKADAVRRDAPATATLMGVQETQSQLVRAAEHRTEQ